MKTRIVSERGWYARLAGLAALGAMAGAANGQVVYFETFEGGAASLSEWTHQIVSQTPIGARGFLGEFNNDVVQLSLTALPAHTAVQIEFDLYLIRSWDGNTFPGPDRWGMNYYDGGNLQPNVVVDTTFAVSSPLGAWRDQAWPDSYPGGSHPQRTGAVENNTLGYDFKGWDDDAVYKMSFLLESDTDDITFEFWASGLQPIEDESWGLDNVKVTLIPTPGSVALLGLGAVAGLRRRRR